ncbi:MAG: nucleotide pyrophosphatase/phosphodiesterase family protein [Anaerolineales bacterium]|jgi:predicted AlkP superfamily pyrophosphatase or phosphodiesterase
METDFHKPRYDDGGFASLPKQIKENLSASRYDAVVLFLIDGFGWRFFEKYQETPFFQQTARAGTVTKLISQFPSTTAAQLTTIHTGLAVGEHGVFEWYYYDPVPDNVIAPLLYSFAGTSQRDTLKPFGVKPSSLFPATNLYRLLKNQGVASTIFQHREYTPSTYSNMVFKGAKAIGYRTLPEALVNMADKLSEIKPPAYLFFYFDRIDAISHEYGPESAQTAAEIQVFLETMDHIFLKALAGSHKKILFLLTADHGQVEIDPQTTIYLNREPAFAGIEKFLKTNSKGELIVPAGSARDFFLYIKPEALDEAQVFLASRLDGRAEVRKVPELVQAGYFGPVISPRFQSRVGNLVILPYRGESVWWFEKDKFEQKFHGHHGGLTKQEMEIPLITWEM